ncbi:putative UBC5-E2 ubiquitin-conjugating enzyme [Tilletiopsis washingtonensis]|uniref:E2 ubiquitin-conjugating enzyme n=1 Tax=Tilletiopsis washingtonensis TaxID=58919 RepID=A0A316ZFI0_9BASI|nr:putative UBC5-E2 ubiquitin-conjugating enzyme [Tilletiopsis washingtonensis]PWN99662.1 putative UBC5-E2 ubiquitin-conjugating enzyme [Tilletiopsis washingtonensis]
MASSKRLTKELMDLNNTPLDGIEITPNESNIYKWTAKLHGPADSPYAGGVFVIELDFPIEYPFKSPRLKFATRVFHPNVDEDGNMCVGLLKSEAWKPSTKAATILLSIQQLLAEPNPDDALVASIAEMYKTDRAKFNKTAQEYTRKHANA